MAKSEQNKSKSNFIEEKFLPVAADRQPASSDRDARWYRYGNAAFNFRRLCYDYR